MTARKPIESHKRPGPITGRASQPEKIMSRKAAKKDATPQRGGKREGAGRKPIHGVRMEQRGISLPPPVWAIVDTLRGSQSESQWLLGIIRLIPTPPAPGQECSVGRICQPVPNFRNRRINQALAD